MASWLSDPRTHGLSGARARVRVIETHFAWVFLVGSWALKLKKSLRQWPLDYRTRASRRLGCETEVRINRRLAPRVYLGVVTIRQRRSGQLVLEPHPGPRTAARATGAVRSARRERGIAVDWLVWMRRLPAAQMMDRMLAAPDSTQAIRRLPELVQLLAQFYREGASAAPMSPCRYLRRAGLRVRANGRVLLARRYGAQRALARRVLDAQRRYLRRHGELLRARAAHVVEGHGDLRPEHVCFGRRIEIIDALEFDRGLRLYDPFEELAFLALECRRLGARAFATRLLAAFRHAMGEAASPSLLRFYMSHRAAVRAKLALWHLRDGRVSDRERWISRANDYLREALQQARAALRTARGSPRATRR